MCVFVSVANAYEKQLMVKPGLKGTVMTNFQISPTGVVLGSTAKGVNQDVSSCVSDVIKSIQFPKPRVGSLVQVRYPFNFRPTGGWPGIVGLLATSRNSCITSMRLMGRGQPRAWKVWSSAGAE